MRSGAFYVDFNFFVILYPLTLFKVSIVHSRFLWKLVKTVSKGEVNVLCLAMENTSSCFSRMLSFNLWAKWGHVSISLNCLSNKNVT